jgi:hypothetical protein
LDHLRIVSGEATVIDTQSNGLSSMPRADLASLRVLLAVSAGWIMACVSLIL